MKRTAAAWALTSGIIAAALLAGGAWITRAPDAMPFPDLVAIPENGASPLWVQRHEVSVAEWNACHDDGGCNQHLIPRAGIAAGQTPATNLSRVDAAEYITWISTRTRHRFRLPTAAEWSAMAAEVLPDAPDPIFTDPNLGWASEYLATIAAPRSLKPRGSFSVTRDGVADFDGPVWEWTQDCAIPDLAARCPAYFVGGEHMAVVPFLERDPARGGCAVGAPPAHLGLRLVTDMAPRD